MSKSTNAVTDAGKAPRETWGDWMDLLSQSELDQIANEVHLIENGAITQQAYDRFDALCNFRRSQKLFGKYLNA